MSTEDVLQEARRPVVGDRRDAYGPPLEAMARVAAWWTAVDGPPRTGREVALELAALKLARAAHQHGRDNCVDAIAYVAVAVECAEVEESA